MAQFRRNHASHHKGLQTTFRLVIFVVIALILLFGGFAYFKKQLEESGIRNTTPEMVDYSLRTYLPTSTGEVVHHRYYSLSYSEKHEQAAWTAYMMDRNMLDVPNVERGNRFNPDYAVTTRSAFHRDYNQSGYTRGHLVPAGDMAFDSIAMRECFYMSNISPQIKAFNNGIWKELEENIRDWTYTSDTLYIITGPILSSTNATIGHENKVSVPAAFFKVILDYTLPEKKAIAFIIPNQESTKRLTEYMVNIDEVEKQTGIDFFNNMLNDGEEEKLESSFEKNQWALSEKRYQLRISKWNFE